VEEGAREEDKEEEDKVVQYKSETYCTKVMRMIGGWKISMLQT
jgi:hypothetical protein